MLEQPLEPPIEETPWHHRLTYRIAAIAAGVVILALAGYFGARTKFAREVEVTTTNPVPSAPAVAGGPSKPVEIVNAPPPILYKPGEKVAATAKEQLPESKKFKSFHYSGGSRTLSSSGICTDAYVAILVFLESDDYRTSPRSARINQAYPCPPSRTFQQDIDVASANLAPGDYYFFVADQGAKGTWYNPR